MLHTSNSLAKVVLTTITRLATLKNTKFFAKRNWYDDFLLYAPNSLRKVVLTTITRPATLRKTNFLQIGVDMTIFASYLEFAYKSGFNYYNTSCYAKKD